MKDKYFIITIDTEGDNQWELEGEITTKNTAYLPRFQKLCEKYEFRPVWLTNFEMANDNNFVSYMKQKQELGLCEIGMHLHAWNSPPEYFLHKTTRQRDYLIEYPIDIMEKKIEYLTELLEGKFNIRPISHRSGRWAMDERYYGLLTKHGYKIDCSVTPLVDWRDCEGCTGMPGTNYSSITDNKPYYIGDILEVPMTIRNLHFLNINNITSIKMFLHEIKHAIIGKKQWLRPGADLSIKGLEKLVHHIESEKTNYCMFMIHSSELMPGGSPNFQSEEEIEKLYSLIEKLFCKIKKMGYKGITLRDYYYKYGNCNKIV